MPRPSWLIALTNGIITSSILLGGINWEAAQSQPIADDTLGNERSVVVPLESNTPGDRIDGGARRGDNLFHSLQQLNIAPGRSVYFSDPGVNNIITRVTGGTSSQIDGTLGVQGGNANLFLINPSGIIFGANASLNVNGSFTATTADAIAFNNQGSFSATNPTAVPLLTVQPSAFGFNQINPAPITNNSIASGEPNPSGLSGFGLRVPEGEGLTLLGGNISMDGGGVNALGGRVEIGGLGTPGTVNRNANGSLNFPDGIARADVSLTNQSFIDVAADSGGSITVNAGELEISDSILSAGIGSNSGFVGAQAGDVTLNADNIRGESSGIGNIVRVGGIGDAGDIRITTSSLSLTDVAQLFASTLGQGNAGDVIINAREFVSLEGGSAIFSSVGDVNVNAQAVGNGGDIRITTGSLSLTNGSQLQASTYGQGNAGDVIINASDRVSLDGVSGIFSSIGASNAKTVGVGNGGDVSITAGSLSLTNNSQLITSTLGQGNVGDVIINARDLVSLEGGSAIFSSVGDANVNAQAVGNGGDISITAGSLSLTNGSQLITSTLGQGNAGDVIIDASDRVSLDGASADAPSAILSSVGAANAKTVGVGDAGDISITTGSLSLTNSAQLLAATLGQGNAGDVIINAREFVSLDGGSAIFSSVGAANVKTVGVGDAGDISITTGTLSLTNNARLDAATLGQGNAGDVIINAREFVSLDGGSAIFSSVGGISANTLAVGNGGDIRITTGSLSLTDGAQLLAFTFGQGNAGDVIINARENVSLDGFPTVILIATGAGAEGQGGNVSITADSVRLTNSSFVAANTENFFSGGSVTFNANSFEATGGAQVLTTTSGNGQAGNITLNVRDRITLSGVGSSNNPITEQVASGLYASTNPNSAGIGGTVTVTTGKLELFDGATIAVSSQDKGKAGDIDITANRVQLNNSSRLSAETKTADGGNIRLNNVELLQLGNGSSISTTAGTAKAGGNGGNINIDSDLILAFPNENSDIRANAFSGSGGEVSIDSQGLFGIAFQAQDNPLTNDITASSEQGLQGNVTITLPDVDPERGLTQLPEEVVDASSRIAQGCRSSDGARQNRGEFIVKGRGGLPPSPTDSLVGDESLATWVTLEQTSGQATSTTIPTPEPRGAAAPIVEAQGWIVDKNGKVQLIATAPTSATQPNLICQRQESK
jgi:filamentous hemagglutinin family protein